LGDPESKGKEEGGFQVSGEFGARSLHFTIRLSSLSRRDQVALSLPERSG